MSRFLAAAAALLLTLPLVTVAEEAPQAPAVPAPAATPGAQAPAAAPAAVPAPATGVEILGEIVAIPEGSSAAYGKTRVLGPKVNLTETAPGTWSGNIRTYDGVMEVTPKRISGVSMNIVVDRDGREWVAQGTWDGKRVRVSFEKEKITLRIDSRYYEMTRVTPDLYATLPRGPGLRVKGDAAGPDPLWPQFFFAVLSSF